MSAPRRRSRAIPIWLGLLALAALLAMLEWTHAGEHVVAPPPDAPSYAPAPDLTAPSPRPQRRRPKPPIAAPAHPPAAVPRRDDVESHCNGIGAFGTCDGALARACVLNAVYSVDCAARHQRCVQTDEGAQCLPSDPATDCSGTEPALCEGNRLRLCIDGSFEQIDCAKRGGVCRMTASGARCTSKPDATGNGSTAGKPPRTEVEICDGRDNDADGRVDEMDVCSAVPLVAFVPDGYQSPQLDVRMQVEIDILNRVYAPTTFRWAKIASASHAYSSFDPKLMTTAARELAESAFPSFYVAVLYVEDLSIEPPKGGMSTMPNEHCGGVRLSDRSVPPDGLIVLPEARQPETLAHEMGHYLGLCHTHQELARITLADAAGLECERTGDGICETPLDPGPARCVRDDVCEVLCPGDDAQPSPINIMSYYIGCRHMLTPEQLTEARRNLSLRRGWFECLNPTACTCTAGITVCPPEMSCQPGATPDARWTCRLDGAALPGGPCSATDECAHGSVCLQETKKAGDAARCVRPCPASDECNCIDVGLSFRVCSEDMPDALAR
jgi:hypothetical protein